MSGFVIYSTFSVLKNLYSAGKIQSDKSSELNKPQNITPVRILKKYVEVARKNTGTIEKEVVSTVISIRRVILLYPIKSALRVPRF